MDRARWGWPPGATLSSRSRRPNLYADVKTICQWCEWKIRVGATRLRGLGNELIGPWTSPRGYNRVAQVIEVPAYPPKIGQTDVYFVANSSQGPAGSPVRVPRATRRRPELWWPDSGRIERPAAYNAREDFVRVPCV